MLLRQRKRNVGAIVRQPLRRSSHSGGARPLYLRFGAFFFFFFFPLHSLLWPSTQPFF